MFRDLMSVILYYIKYYITHKSRNINEVVIKLNKHLHYSDVSQPDLTPLF